MPHQYLDLGSDFGEIPLLTIGDSAFPQFPWLIKTFPDTRDPKKRFYNARLCGARVVTENAYGMLKGRWRFIYKKCEAKMRNVKYVLMACVLLHNLCIERRDPCNPRWKLRVDQINMIPRNVPRKEDKVHAGQIANKVADWVYFYA